MALTSDQPLQTLRSDLRVKKSFPADAATYYVGELIMVGAASNTAKAISASVEPATQVVGVVCEHQVVLVAGDPLTVESGYFVLSSSGFTNNEVNKLAWASSSTAVQDTQGSNLQVIGRFKGFTDAQGANNAIFDIGNVPSGSVL